MTTKQVSELTDAEMCLVMARHQIPDAKEYIQDQRDFEVEVYDEHDLIGVFNLNWQTIGPLVEKYKVRLPINWKGSMVEACARALLQMWHPDGVNI